MTEGELLHNVRQLSQNFTHNRKSLSDYLTNPDMVSAYAWFYLPTNVYKLSFFLSQLSQLECSELEKCHLVDFGTGPGTFALAWNLLFETSAGTTAFDHSEAMLEQGRKLAAEFLPARSVTFTSRLEDIPNKHPKVLLMGNVINENNQSWFSDILKKINPNYLLLIEPGTSAQFKQMVKIRQQLITEGWDIHYPCQSSLECPLSQSVDWCHQVVYPQLAPQIHRLCQLAQIDRRTLPAIIHFYKNPISIDWAIKQTLSAQQLVTGRTLQYLGENKHSLNYKICRLEEGKNVIENWEIPKREIAKEKKKELEKNGIGGQIKGQVIKKMGTNTIKVKVPTV